MVLPSINQLNLMIYKQIKIVKSNYKDITYICGRNAYQNNTNIKSCTRITSASINSILTLTREIICTIYLSYTLMNHLSIEKQTLMDLFAATLVQLKYFINVYTFYIHDFHFQSTFIFFTSIITIFNVLWIVFINCTVIGFYKSYYLSLTYSIIIYLSIASSEMRICIVFQWIKQYFNKINDNFDTNKPEINQKYQYNGNIHCVSIASICCNFIHIGLAVSYILFAFSINIYIHINYCNIYSTIKCFEQFYCVWLQSW